MRFGKLVALVFNEAESLKMDAAYSGAHNDGGASNLLIKLEEFKTV